jgi:predicted dehydrogenase
MLEADIVDAVLILAPVALHHQVALDVLAADKHVLIEKPFAISVRAGRKIVAEANQRGLVLGVAENLRYAEGVRAMGWAVNEGVIGRPQLWISGGVGNEWSPNRIVARTAWRHRKLDAGGGGAIDIGVHLMHQIRYVMGPVDEVSAYVTTMEEERVDHVQFGAVRERVRNEVEDAFFANLRFANGAMGTSFWSWAGRGARTALDGGPVVYGTAGSIKGDEIVLDDGFHAKTVDLFSRRVPPEVRRAYFPGGVRDAFGLELYDFVSAIRDGRQMEASGEEGLLDLAMAYGILESATANRPVKVSDVLEGTVATYQAEIDQHYRL